MSDAAPGSKPDASRSRSWPGSRTTMRSPTWSLSAALDDVAARSEPAQDRGLVTDLVYGTLRRQRSCDFLADRFLTTAPPPAARRALRLGAYQLAFRTDIPAYAAVDATVSAAPKRFRQFDQRRPPAGRRQPTGRRDLPRSGDAACRIPDWMIERLGADLGHEDAVASARGDERAAIGHDPRRRVRPGPWPRNGLPIWSRPARASWWSICAPRRAARRPRWPPAGPR